jgi:hypothetical protein
VPFTWRIDRIGMTVLVSGVAAVAAPSNPGPASAVDEASRELAAEASRLLRIRRGELAEPVEWTTPDLRSSVQVIASQLTPIRSRAALASSYAREAGRSDAIRLAYALAWLGLERRLTSITTRRRRSRPVTLPIRGRA